MDLVDELHAIAAALDGAGIDHVVCGGVAVTMHGAMAARPRRPGEAGGRR